MEFRPPPAWLMKYGNPGPFIRPEMKSGLQGLWLPHVGHGGSTLWDVSGKASHGEVVSGETFPSHAVSIPGPVLDFDNDAIEATVENSDVFTALCLFMLPNGWDTDSTGSLAIIHKDDESDGFFCMLSSADGGRMRFGTNHGNIQTTRQTWPAGQWFSIALVQETSNSAYIYVDGTEDVSGNNGYVQYDDVPLQWGYRSFNSAPDDVLQLAHSAYYSRALSPATIRALSNDFWVTMFQEPRRVWTVPGVSIPLFMHQYRRRRIKNGW